MKITLLTYGSQGDVEPFLSLGKGLLESGHQVRLAAPGLFSSLASNSRIDYIDLPGDPQQLVQDLVEEAGSSWWHMVRSMASFVIPLAKDVFTLARDSCRDADLVIHSFLLTNTGYEIARENDIPDLSLQTFPVFSSTAAFPAPVAPDLPLGGLYRRLTHDLVTGTFWQGSRMIYNRVRKQNPELPPLTNWPFSARNEWQTPIIYAFSPSVIPQPADWRAGARITGYLFDQSPINWTPEPGLAEFLEKGPAPLTAAFGSTRSSKLKALYHKIIDAVSGLGGRAILVGTEDFDLPATPGIYQSGYIPYDWIFERSAGVIHHGGAGTTGKTLRAGIPGQILPFTSDQPFWARQVHKLGAGPEPLHPEKCTSSQLGINLNLMVDDSGMKTRAREIGQLLKNEDGVSNAVSLIERIGGLK